MKKIIAKKSKSPAPQEYAKCLNQIKKDIVHAQIKATQSISKELILLYWNIGNIISKNTAAEGWGAKIILHLAADLEKSFPGIQGFSVRNLKYMKKFAESYPDSISATAVALIPWGHNVTLLEQLSSKTERLWYAQKSIENGWSRSMLEMWIESDLFHRQGKAITNFKKTLPSPDSDMAQQALKDPYNFDFLTLTDQAKEREVELGLITHIQNFLLELGQGFAFIGRQYHLMVGNTDIYIDILFYHVELRCFIVIELKTQQFDARDVGQMNLYLSAVDSALKHPQDAPTIGLLLCKSKDNYVAEYALRNVSSPIGIASFTTKLVESLPKELKGKLPSIKEIEAELKKTNMKKARVKKSSKK